MYLNSCGEARPEAGVRLQVQRCVHQVREAILWVVGGRNGEARGGQAGLVILAMAIYREIQLRSQIEFASDVFRYRFPLRPVLRRDVGWLLDNGSIQRNNLRMAI